MIEWDSLAEQIFEYFSSADNDTIYENAVKKFKDSPQNIRETISGHLDGLVYLTGTIDETRDDYSLIRIYTDMLKERIEDFKWLYDTLGDYRSKSTLIKIARYWFEFDLSALLGMRENHFRDYFDLDLVPDVKDSVLVDCGAFIGDTIIDFYLTYGDVYRRIYAYEMVSENFRQLVENTSELRDIVYKNCGVGESITKMFIDDDTKEAGSRLAEKGTVPVDVVPLDGDIREPVSIIKMDVEGAEMDALSGAESHIIDEKPVLMISAYHKPADIFDIPRWICSQREDYKLYLRSNGGSVWPADFVLFAL